jgi:hypothetical protein
MAEGAAGFSPPSPSGVGARLALDRTLRELSGVLTIIILARAEVDIAPVILDLLPPVMLLLNPELLPFWGNF